MLQNANEVTPSLSVQNSGSNGSSARRKCLEDYYFSPSRFQTHAPRCTCVQANGQGKPRSSNGGGFCYCGYQQRVLRQGEIKEFQDMCMNDGELFSESRPSKTLISRKQQSFLIQENDLNHGNAMTNIPAGYSSTSSGMHALAGTRTVRTSIALAPPPTSYSQGFAPLSSNYAQNCAVVQCPSCLCPAAAANQAAWSDCHFCQKKICVGCLGRD